MGKFRDKRINGVTYTMGHLADSIVVVQKGNISYRVHVTYGCHCFTEEVKPHHTRDYLYQFRHETRAFCTVRHGLSHNLPNYIASLLGRSVYLAQKANFFFVRSAGGQYVVFFSIKQATNPKYDAILIVQSAHLRPTFTHYGEPVTFEDLVEAKATGTAFTPGPRQLIQRS